MVVIPCAVHRGTTCDSDRATRPEVTAIADTARGMYPLRVCYHCAFAGYGDIAAASMLCASDTGTIPAWLSNTNGATIDGNITTTSLIKPSNTCAA